MRGSPREVLRASARTADGEGRRESAGPEARLPLQPRWLPMWRLAGQAGELAGASGASKQLRRPGWRRRPGLQQEQAWGCREGRATSPLPPSSPGPGRSSPGPRTRHQSLPGSRRGLVGWTVFLISLRAVNECRAVTEERRSVSKCVQGMPGPGRCRNRGQTLVPTLAAPPVMEGAGRGHTHPQGQGRCWTVGT